MVAVVTAADGCSTLEVAERLTWSRPWEQSQGLVRRSAIGETYAHLLHLERRGLLSNTENPDDHWSLVLITRPDTSQLTNYAIACVSIPPERYMVPFVYEGPIIDAHTHPMLDPSEPIVGTPHPPEKYLALVGGSRVTRAAALTIAWPNDPERTRARNDGLL